MKRILCLLLCVLFLLGGCAPAAGNDGTEPTQTTGSETTDNTETTANSATEESSKPTGNGELEDGGANNDQGDVNQGQGDGAGNIDGGAGEDGDVDHGGDSEADGGQVGEFEEVYEEEEDVVGGDSGAGDVVEPDAGDSGDIAAGGSIHYYFMAGEGQIFPQDDHFTRWGDSCLIVFPNGETMLIDTGLAGLYKSLKQRLHSLGVYDLDYLVLTHPHDDHAGAIWSGLFKDFKIGQVYHNGIKNPSWGKDSSNAHIENICKKNGVPCKALAKGDVLNIGQTTAKVLWPTEEAKNTYGTSSSGAINNLSLVIRFDYGKHSSLFTGDLYKTYKGTSAQENPSRGYLTPNQKGAEQWITSLYTSGEMDVDLLKLPHHGDPNTSNSADMFRATTPKLAVATGFLPLESGYTSVYKGRGYSGPVLFDRKYGYVHVYATADGKLNYESSRSNYLADFGATWNEALERS